MFVCLFVFLMAWAPRPPPNWQCDYDDVGTGAFPLAGWTSSVAVRRAQWASGATEASCTSAGWTLPSLKGSFQEELLLSFLLERWPVFHIVSPLAPRVYILEKLEGKGESGNIRKCKNIGSYANVVELYCALNTLKKVESWVMGSGLKSKEYFYFLFFFDLQNLFILLLLPQYKFFFLLYSMVTQLHMHVYILFSHIIMLHPKWLDRVPSATPQEKNTFKIWLHMCVSVREWERVRRTERNTLRWEKTCGESLTAACLQNGYKPVVCDCNFWKCGLCTMW